MGHKHGCTPCFEKWGTRVRLPPFPTPLFEGNHYCLYTTHYNGIVAIHLEVRVRLLNPNVYYLIKINYFHFGFVLGKFMYCSMSWVIKGKSISEHIQQKTIQKEMLSKNETMNLKTANFKFLPQTTWCR